MIGVRLLRVGVRVRGSTLWDCVFVVFESLSRAWRRAQSVDDNGGLYIVPAFSGLFAPYWRSDARGVIVGLTRFVTKAHLARAVLEATAWQTREIVDAMNADAGVELTSLKVDGGMVVNDLLMQIQADVLGAEVVRPRIAETTASKWSLRYTPIKTAPALEALRCELSGIRS